MKPERFERLKNKSFFYGVVATGLMISVFLFILPLLSVPEALPSDWVLFGGRFHPLVIHFPIVLLFVLLMVEILVKARWINTQFQLKWFLLVLTCLSSLLAVLIGFALYQSGGYSGETLKLHFWSGIVLSLFVMISFFSFWYETLIQEKEKASIYFYSLVTANLLVVFVSHQGGSLTHGEGFLTEHFPLKSNENQLLEHKSLNQMLVFADVLQPTLDTRCFSCHNQNKTKGEYLMTDFSSLIKGGKSGKAAIRAGLPDQSELLHRVSLPDNHDDHMPPEGKTPLTEYEIKMLKWWIQEGASDTLQLAHVLEDSMIFSLLAKKAQSLQQQRILQQQKTLELDGLIRMVAHDGQSFMLNKNSQTEALELSMLFPPSGFDDNQLAELQAVFPHIDKASFVGSEISDDGLYFVGQMKNLRSLYLQQTSLRGNGLIHLKNLEKLEILDLSSTQIDDPSLLHVLQLKSLKILYLHDTDVNPVIVDAMQRNNPDLQIHLVRGPFF